MVRDDALWSECVGALFVLLTSKEEETCIVGGMTCLLSPLPVRARCESRPYTREPESLRVGPKHHSRTPAAALLRNEVCYPFTRECLVERAPIISDGTVPRIVERDVGNVDEPVGLELANLLTRA